ncbi:MAG: flagellar basal body rod C-terminal domain-containing protein, partial [Syntrophales bacterium]
WTAMSNATDIALTALRAFDLKNQVIANNIANVNTDGFKKSRADMTQMTLPGVTVSVQQVNTPGDTVTIGGVERQASNVDVAEELIHLMVNSQNYEANIRTVKTTQEMQGTLFDILG